MRLIAAVALAVAVVVGSTAPPVVAAPPDLTAEGAVLWDPADDRVLWGKAARMPLRPASTTKIMTVLLALEAGAIDDTVTVSATAVEVGRRPGAATLGLRVGQQIAMRSLLSGLVLRSGNDAAVAVAEHIAGSEAAFVEKMNARAAEIGMRDTTFLNATGLTDDSDHASTALDLARLAEVALRNDEFAAWAAAPALDVEDLGSLTNRNELLTRYDGATGVKTGYTNLAGLCLVASATREGRALIAVVLGADDSAFDRHFTEAAAILDHGFDDFRRPHPVRAGVTVTHYRWSDASVPVVAAEPLARTVPATARVRWRVVLDPGVARPVEAGHALGSAELVVGRTTVDTTPVLAGEAVTAPADRPAAAAAGGAVQDALRTFGRLYAADRRP